MTGCRRAGAEPLPWARERGGVLRDGKKCYLEAWTWAKSHMDDELHEEGDADEDGGAVRREFIANWTSPEFWGVCCAAGVSFWTRAVRAQGEEAQEVLLRRRGLAKWRELLEAEEAFWPAVEA